MTREINVNRLQLKVGRMQSTAEGRALAKAVAGGLADSFRRVDAAGSVDAVKVRVPGGRAMAGDVAGAVRSAIARETSNLRNEKRRG